MAHLQYMPGDPRLVDQLVYELKSKGIFDQFRKDCIADVDTRPAYQNLRQRVENSVSTFLSRQTWQPDLNKNQLREKLRKHILDGNYLEQGVERIVDQVVNPKVASMFIPKVEDLVYNYLGITKKKSPAAETSNEKIEDLLPNDLEAVSPGSVKSNEDKNECMELDGQEEHKMELDEDKPKSSTIDNSVSFDEIDKITSEIQLPSDINDDKSEIPLPDEEIKTENIPEPKKMEVEKIELPKELVVSTDIPLPHDAPKEEKNDFFKPINSDDDDSSSDSSLRRNMSPLTPIRNYNNENSCDAQQAFEDELVDDKNEEHKELNSFRFAIEAKSPENTTDAVKPEKKESENNLAYQFNNQVNINTPLYEDSSNSNILHIDYESDANSKVNLENKGLENDQSSKDSRKEHKTEERRSSHKSSHRSRDSRKHSSSKDKRSDSKHNSRDSSRHDKRKLSKDDSKSKSSDKDRSRDRSDKKDSRDSSKHRSSHKSSHKDSKSHRSSSSSQKHSSKNDEKKSTSSQKDKEKNSDRADKSKDSRSSSQKSDKDRKSSTSSRSDKSKSKHDDKDKDKKSKKEKDDHYSVSGRGNPNRRSTDRDSNDGSSSSKGSNNQSSSKSTNGKKESKSSSKSETTSTSGESTSPSDKENVVQHGTSAKDLLQHKPIVRIDSHLETPVASPPRLPFVPDVTIKKPKYAANLAEAKRLMKMRKFLDEEQKRMNQEAALLLEFQANVRPSLSQVYSSIPGPELEFACITNSRHSRDIMLQNNDNTHYTNNQLLTVLNDESDEENSDKECRATTSTEPIAIETKESVHEPVRPQNIDNKYNDINYHDVNKCTEYPDIKKEIKDEMVIEAKNNKDVPSNDALKDKIVDPLSHDNKIKTEASIDSETKLKYFSKHEKYDAEIENVKFTSFFKKYSEKSNNNIYLINCDSYEESIIRDVSKGFGNFDIVNYIKNGHLKLPSTNIIKNVNIATEISLPIEIDYEMNDSDSPKSQMFSPGKSECSFELSSDYDAKLTEMVNKTSRQEIMEIILGNVLDASPSKMPRIDYFTDSNIDDAFENNMKRKISEETTVNNNRHVLTPNKIRRLSTEQISSTTQEIEEPANKISNSTRSKYLGKAKRVGLPRPRKPLLSNSPSSDKSVENYEQNTPTQSPNGKIKRSKVQRYDTSDLYKPKLHYLSRRNHIT